MAFPKQIRDIVYKSLQEPTLDNFREFLQNQTGEHSYSAVVDDIIILTYE